jgi:hypothetical protein
MAPEQPKSRRLSLTKKQLQQESGEALLSLLTEIVSDGKISEDEVRRLHDWTKNAQESDMPAVGFLRDAIEAAVADGSLSDADRLDIHLAIERVLPVTNRTLSKETRENAEAAALPPPKITREDLQKLKVEPEVVETAPRRLSWRDDAVTKPQRDFLKSLGGVITPGMTKGEASDLIEVLLGNKPITPRQQMVMRFWGRERQPGEGPREISEWMDSFYSENPDRKKAWTLFKDECEDDGLQGDPMRVPFGTGPRYLERIQRGGEAAIPRFVAKSSRSSASLYDEGEGKGSYFVIFTMFAITACVVGYLFLK